MAPSGRIGMDPLTITATCIGLTATITKISFSVNQFIRNVRDARSDMDTVSRELGSLNTVLEIVADDVETHGAKLEENIRIQIMNIVGNCSGVMERLETSLKKHQEERLMAKLKWTFNGKMEMEGYSRELASHRGALDIALNFVTFSITRDIKTDTEAILEDTADLKESTQQGTDKILAEIAKLRAQLPDAQEEPTGSEIMLQQYLDNLTTYAETAYAGSVPESDSELEEDELLSHSDTVIEEPEQGLTKEPDKTGIASSHVDSGEVALSKTQTASLPSNPSKDSSPALPAILHKLEAEASTPSDEVQVKKDIASLILKASDVDTEAEHIMGDWSMAWLNFSSGMSIEQGSSSPSQPDEVSTVTKEAGSRETSSSSMQAHNEKHDDQSMRYMSPISSNQSKPLAEKQAKPESRPPVAPIPPLEPQKSRTNISSQSLIQKEPVPSSISAETGATRRSFRFDYTFPFHKNLKPSAEKKEEAVLSEIEVGTKSAIEISAITRPITDEATGPVDMKEIEAISSSEAHKPSITEHMKSLTPEVRSQQLRNKSSARELALEEMTLDFWSKPLAPVSVTQERTISKKKSYLRGKDYNSDKLGAIITIIDDDIVSRSDNRTEWIRNFTLSGGNPNAMFRLEKSMFETYAICEAVRLKDEYWLNKLLQAGVDVNVIAKPLSFTPLQAALDWKPSIVRKIVEAGADVNLKFQVHGYQPREWRQPPYPLTYLVEKYGCNVARFELITYVASLLLLNGAAIDAYEESRGTALHVAVNLPGNEKMVEFLLDHGANPSFECGHWGTPLHGAVRTYDNQKKVSLLLERGANPNIVFGRDGTPLDAAISFWGDNINVVELLLEQGADPNILSGENRMPIFSAILKAEKRPKYVATLLEFGASVDAITPISTREKLLYPFRKTRSAMEVAKELKATKAKEILESYEKKGMRERNGIRKALPVERRLGYDRYWIMKNIEKSQKQDDGTVSTIYVWEKCVLTNNKSQGDLPMTLNHVSES